MTLLKTVRVTQYISIFNILFAFLNVLPVVGLNLRDQIVDPIGHIKKEKREEESQSL